VSGVSFGDVRLDFLEEKVRVDYGGVRGWETFENETQALTALARWSDDEIGRVSKELAGLAKLKRYIRRTL
jgi:hypothetical protein